MTAKSVPEKLLIPYLSDQDRKFSQGYIWPASQPVPLPELTSVLNKNRK